MDIKLTKKHATEAEVEGAEAQAVTAPGCSHDCGCVKPGASHGHLFSRFATPISIIGGSLLISMTIMYAAIVQPTVAQRMAGTQAPTGAAQGQQPAANQPVSVTERADAAVIGDPSAPVTLVEFSDFQCPFCQKFFKESFGQLKAKYIDTGKVKVVFRHFPLPIHANAEKAAEAGECANRQGKFLVYHDVLFTKGQADGTGLALADLKKYAREVGLDGSQFDTCLDSGATAGIVQGDFQAGQDAGVGGTPSFVLGGKLVVGAQPFSVFDAALTKALSN